MKLLFTGDTGLLHKEVPVIDEKLKTLFSEADFRICNLEGPIIKNSQLRAIPKRGPSIGLSSSTLDFLNELQITHLSMANNHIMDYGNAGLEETLSQTGKFITFGAGLSYLDAYKPVFFEKDGLTIGALAVAENGFGGAVSGKNGFATYDGADIKKMISELKTKVDFLVLIFHAGAENVPFPLPEWKEIYHRFCDAGVDAIVAHHPHVPQGIEKYNKSIIVYSLGNFYFDYEENSADSYSVILNFKRGQEIIFQIIPHSSCRGNLRYLDDIKIDKLNNLLNTEESDINKTAVEMMNNIYLQYYHTMISSQGIFYSVFQRLYREIPGLRKKRTMQRDEYLWLFHNLCIDTHCFIQKRALRALQKGP